jgi:hypothetical protein
MSRHIVILSLLIIAACAPTTERERSGTSLTQRQGDEKACLDIASYQAFDESDKSKPIYPPFKETQFSTDGGGSGGDDGGGITTSYSRRGARVYELMEYCMQQRGYHLVPIAQK